MNKNFSIQRYQENKERLPKKARERYHDLSKEEKEKKQQYGRECYKNHSEDEKKSLLGIEERYYRMRKKKFITAIRK